MTDRERLPSLETVCPDWNRSRADAVWTAISNRRRRRTVLRMTGLSLVLAASFVFAAVQLWPASPGVRAPSSGTTSAPAVVEEALPDPVSRAIILRDGSEIAPLSDGFRMVIERETPEEVRIRILEGDGLFTVTKNPGRRFLAMRDDVTVEVAGTVFAMARNGDRVSVSVKEGAVLVRWNGGEDRLSAGGEGLYPPSDAVAEAAGQPSARQRPDAWREPAERGDYAAAAALLRGPGAVRDTVEDLLLAADVMRGSHRPDEALTCLSRISRDHAADPRAATAEFTRGRILLFQLHRPAEAAQAFAAVRALSPGSSLAQDALAREVEALHQAGDTDRLRLRAEEYARTYPRGRRIDAVRRMGGLEPAGTNR
jgi:transmembrane sensor